MWSEIARLRTTSPRNARRSYESVRRSTQEECVKACSARSAGSSSRRDWSVSSASGRLLGHVRRHEVGDLANGVQLRGLVVGDADSIGVLELDHQLDEVKRVGVEVLLEPRGLVDRSGIHHQLGGQVIPHPLEHLLPGHGPLPTLTAGADAEASVPLSRSAASVRSTTPSSAARWAPCTAVATPIGVALPCVTNPTPRRPSRIPAPTESWFSSVRSRAALRRIRRPPSDEIGPDLIASRSARMVMMAVPSTAFRATFPVNPSVTTTSTTPPVMSLPSMLPAKSSGPSARRR